MTEALTLTLACVGGAVLGTVFFGGLWWTVRRGVASSRPALWFLGSLLVRMAVTLGGFLLIGRGNWERLLLCFVGFVAARLIVTWRTRPLRHDRTGVTAGEATHAPQP